MHQPTTTSTDEVAFVRAHPQLFVADVERSAAWYRDSLGFTVDYLYGEPPFYAGVSRDGVVLNLRHVDVAPMDGAAREAEQLLSASIVVSDATALFLQWRDAGIDLYHALEEQPWRALEFVVRDPDGNLVLFGSPASTASG